MGPNSVFGWGARALIARYKTTRKSVLYLARALAKMKIFRRTRKPGGFHGCSRTQKSVGHARSFRVEEFYRETLRHETPFSFIIHSGDGCSSGGPWKSTVEAVVTVPRWACPCRASGESGRERAVASMVAHSEVEMATGVAVMMGAVIAATAAVIGWRLGGGGGLIRPRVASTISAVRRSERLAKAGSNMLISAVPPFGRLSGTR